MILFAGFRISLTQHWPLNRCDLTHYGGCPALCSWRRRQEKKNHAKAIHESFTVDTTVRGGPNYWNSSSFSNLWLRMLKFCNFRACLAENRGISNHTVSHISQLVSFLINFEQKMINCKVHAWRLKNCEETPLLLTIFLSLYFLKKCLGRITTKLLNFFL